MSNFNHKSDCSCNICKMMRGEIFGENHPNYGKHPSKEKIEQQKQSIKSWYNNPENKDKIKAMGEKGNVSRKKYYARLREIDQYEIILAERGKNISKAKKGIPFTEEHKQAIKNGHWTKKKNANIILEKMPKFAKGNIAWNTGLTKETDERMANSLASKPHSMEWNQKVKEALRKSEKHKVAVNSEANKKRLREARMAYKMPSCKTNPEIKFENLCKKYNLPYSYVGDGQFWLGYPPRNPDFMNVNGKKQVVEIHGIYWHLWKDQKNNPFLTKQDVEKEEQNHYKKYGFDCVVIWDDEVKDEQFVLNKLNG